jgi:hypothetical protein
VAEKTYTLKELARLVAGTSDAEPVKEAARRIQHWASHGMLWEPEGYGADGMSVGRGRVRRYPQDIAYKCALYAAMADRDFSTAQMGSVAMILSHDPFGGRKGGPDLVEAAKKGEGADVVLVVDMVRKVLPERLSIEFGMTQEDYPPSVRRRELFRLPAEIPSWEGGIFLNLSAIFAKVRA